MDFYYCGAGLPGAGFHQLKVMQNAECYTGPVGTGKR